MKVAAYCRVSTDKDDQINSLQNQLQYFRSYIENHAGWELADVFADEGTTGTSTKHREAFHRMIEQARKREIDFIITKEVSRFARNTVDTLTYTRQLKALGIGVLFINDNINTLDNEGEFRLTIMASVAQEESRKISERVKWGQRRRMEQGIVFGNNSILGYTLSNGKLQINAQQARVVQDIFYKYVDEGKGARVIAKELNQAGIRPVYAELWSSESILKILKNEKYAGDLLQRKTHTPDFLSHSKKQNHNADDMIYLPEHHEAIIDRIQWNKAQEMMQARRRLPKVAQTKYSRSHWCSGKVICGICGKRFLASQSKSKDAYVQTWLCSTRKKHGGRHASEDGLELGCDNPRVRNDILLLCLNEALSLINLPAAELKAELLGEIKKRKLVEDETDRLTFQKQLVSLKNKRESLILSYLDQVLLEEEFLQTKSGINQEIKRIEQKLEQLAAEERAMLQQQQGAIEISTAMDAILSGKQASEAFFEQLIERIVVYPGMLCIQFLELPFCFEIQFRTSRANHEYKAIITGKNRFKHVAQEAEA